MSNEVEQPQEQTSPAEDRRHEPRTKSKVKRTVMATVEDEAYGSRSSHLYVVDISENGIRVNLDRELEPESKIKIALPLQAFGFGLEGDFQADCRVVWARPLAGGTCVLGMEYENLQTEHRESLNTILEHWAEKQDLELETLPVSVDAKYRLNEEESWSRTVGVRAISRDGFRFAAGQDIEPSTEILIRILLESGTVENKARVKWCESVANNAYDIGCEFQSLSSGDESYIDLHLRRCRHRPL
jgi:hypothetical protein